MKKTFEVVKCVGGIRDIFLFFVKCVLCEARDTGFKIKSSLLFDKVEMMVPVVRGSVNNGFTGRTYVRIHQLLSHSSFVVRA